MNAPLVSIIIPTYNSGHYLNRCLTSIQMQTYKNLEIVIVDAHSTDQTLKIIDQFKTKLTIHCLSLGKSTQSEARNLGLQQATGEYIAFCDSDDFYLPEKIKQQVAAMENTAIDVTYFDVLHFYSGQTDKLFINQHPQDKDILAECIANQTINLNSLMVKKSFLDAHQLFFPLGEMGRYGEDGNFIFQLAVHHARFKKIEGNWSVVEVRQDSHTQWEAQWKMKHYAIQYRINAMSRLSASYQTLMNKTIKSLKLKLAISLVLVNQHQEAQAALKGVFNPPASWMIHIIFALLRWIPLQWTHGLITTLWTKRRMKACHRYIDINQTTHQQLTDLLQVSTI